MVQNKFASDDPYILSALIATARSNQADLNVVITEQDYLRATAVTQQQQGLTGAIANPVPNVSNVAQSTVGNSQNPPPPPLPCFLGHTPVTYWDNGWKQMPISRLAILQDRPRVLSFDGDKQVQGEILHVSCKIRFDYLYVTFEDQSGTCVAPEHRYWTPKGYTQIQHMLGKFVYNADNKPIRVTHIDRCEVRQGIPVFNLSVDKYENYVANGHRVHNNKSLSDP